MSSEIKTTYYDNGQIKQRGSNKKHELWFSNGQLSGESHLTEFGRYIYALASSEKKVPIFGSR